MTTLSTEKREKVLRRIEGLMSKTVAGGCSEEEAVAASEIVGKLLDEYNLTMTDVELGDLECTEETVETPNKRNRHPIDYCMRDLAHFCDVRVWRSKRYVLENNHHVLRVLYVFFGLPKDVQVAQYLYHVIYGSMNREVKNFKKGEYYQNLYWKGERKIASNSFLRGMSERLCVRLSQMKHARNEDMVAQTGRDLVVVKGIHLEKAMFQAGISIKKAKKNYNRHGYDSHANSAGYAAGGNVGLHKGVTSSGGQRALR